MSLIIRKPGILSTIQDLGRSGYQNAGVNPGGVMDTAATSILNTVLGNQRSDAVLECHFPAPEIEFETDTVFAIGGADFDAELDRDRLNNWSSVFAGKGAVLKFRSRLSGTRTYIAVPGGFQVDEWLGSRSTNLTAGFGGRRLVAGDRLEFRPQVELPSLRIGPSVRPHYSRFPTVRILPGSESDFLTAISERDFLNEGFTLTNDCDRMGYRLSGKPLYMLDRSEMVSAAVTFGAIQLLPDGQLIVLMADHQTSGGYPRIGNVISADLPLLAQCGPGDGVSFEKVSIDVAEGLALQFENELNFLRVGCRLQKQNA